MTLPPGYLEWERWKKAGGYLSEWPQELRDKRGHRRVIPHAWQLRYAQRNPPVIRPASWQSVLFLAQPMTDVLASKPHYKVAVTADPGYGQYVRRDHADLLRGQGRAVYVWYVPTQVSRERADEVAVELGATGIIGQAENPDEFDASIAHGRRCVIGNVSALRDDQAARVRSGEIAFIQEDYWNAQPWSQRDYRGLPVAAGCIAVYDGHAEHPEAVPADWQPKVPDYLKAGRLLPGDGLYGPGATPGDFAGMP